MSQIQNRPVSRAKIALRILLIYIGVILLLEFAGQVTIRVIEARRPSAAESEGLLAFDAPLVGFALQRNLNRRMGDWTVSTNRWGFREGDMPLAKPEDEVRIAVVGGSTVFGWGVQNEESIPAYLQSLVDRSTVPSPGHKHVRIINAGCPWYASWHEAASIYFRVLEFHPDWVIVMDGLNDTAQALAPSWTPIIDGYSDVPTRLSAERRQTRGLGNQLVATLTDISPTLRYVHARLKARSQMQTGTYHPEVWEQYVTYMTRVKKLNDSQGIRTSFFFQPVMHVDKPLDYFETQHDGTSMRQPAFAETFRQLYRAGEQRILADSFLQATSLKTAFASTKEPIYLDGLHYNAKGNRILAELIYKSAIEPALPTLVSSPIARN
jgi:lysophospholipase L1-like esterase